MSKKIKNKKVEFSPDLISAKKSTVEAVKELTIPEIWKKIVLRLAILFSVVALSILYSDKKEYFAGDQTNNHVERKWRSFYRFTGERKRNVDIVVFGNSHASAGVEPYIVSTTFGANCFILNTPGSGVIDAYFNLKEMIDRNRAPKIAIIETSCITGGEIGEEWGRIQSLEAKKGLFTKLKILPFLFPSPDDWPKALSTTIRNHSFLLTDSARIEFNLKNPGEKNPDKYKLDLGRFSHGNNSLKPSTLAKYDSLGSPIKGTDFVLNEISKKYLKKFDELCKTNDIQVVLYTVPMYYRTYENYSGKKKNIVTEINKIVPNIKWLDLQEMYNDSLYGTTSFNDEYSSSQHPTYEGMVKCTYQLCKYLKENFNDRIPNKSAEKEWQEDFMDQSEYLLHQSMPSGMPNAKLIARNKNVNGKQLEEAVISVNPEYQMLIVKVPKSATPPKSIIGIFQARMQNQTTNVSIQMAMTNGFYDFKYDTYQTILSKDIDILEVIAF
jgi:hypothetical protein